MIFVLALCVVIAAGFRPVSFKKHCVRNAMCTNVNPNPMFCGVNNGPKKERRRKEVTNLRKPVREREWICSDGHSSLNEAELFSSSTAGSERGSATIKVVTYNVLGPLHGESSKHDYAAEAITRWTRRRDKLIEELVDLDADLLCLQEVSQKALKETFIPRLVGAGLECTGFAPTKNNNGKSGKYAHKYVGCAIFTRSSKITLLESKRVHLRDWAPLAECKSDTLREEINSHWNCMAMGLYQVRGEGGQGSRRIMIGNAHLFWNPARADVKVLQAAACTHALAKFLEEVNARGEGEVEGGAGIKVLLCGDFNTPPTLQQDYDPFMGLDDPETDPYATTGLDCGSSGVGVTGVPTGPFEFFSSGRLDNSHPQHPDNWSLRLGDKGRPNPRMGPLVCPFPSLRHPFIDVPAFRPFQPLFTTRTDEFSGWIDHVWCGDGVEVAAIMVPPVRCGDLRAGLKSREFAPIPNKEHPSDHLPLGVMLRL